MIATRRGNPIPSLFCREIPTSLVPFRETEHGRLRRKQRGIDKKDLQAAMKYGKRHRNRWDHMGCTTSRYVYNDITYIVNDITGEEVTSYSKPLELEMVPTTTAHLKSHREAQKRIEDDPDCWTSNTVIVVDTSGSMKESDVWGTRNRLGAVWVSVALDYIAHRLEVGENGRPTDVISIITLSATPTILVEEMPCTWLLYNVIVRIYNESICSPRGHGPFIPALQVAEELLTRNEANSSSVSSLIFLSDGSPSDNGLSDREGAIKAQIGSLASKFGRRLTFTAIGIGDKQHFRTLEAMVKEAQDYDAKAALHLPSLTSESIGITFTSSLTTTLETQREITNVNTQQQKRVRNVSRESKTKANEYIESVSEADFWLYSLERVCRKVYQETIDKNKKSNEFVKVPLRHPAARYVAMSKKPFGEGAERFAYRFYEVATDRKTIVGKPLVAKESRFVLEADESDGVGTETERKKFVRTFCKTQQIARRLAQSFNEKMNCYKRIHVNTPRVRFLDCDIYELNDARFGRLSVLVEEKLDPNQWKKWNSNNGYVEGVIDSGKPNFQRSYNERNGFGLLQIHDTSPFEDLGILEEGSEEDDDSEEDDNNYYFNKLRDIQPKLFSPGEVAQAFSHFSYKESNQKRLVCDLQGVFDAQTNFLVLSDPVIHYYNPQANSDNQRRGVHGRTDRGRKGIEDFFETHNEVHGHLCSLLLKGFHKCKRRN